MYLGRGILQEISCRNRRRKKRNRQGGGQNIRAKGNKKRKEEHLDLLGC